MADFAMNEVASGGIADFAIRMSKLSATQPSTQPIATPTVALRATPPLPPIYRALLGRSLFAKPGVGVAISASHTVAASGPGATLVLRGVGVSDGVRTAYIEDMSSRQITRHREGEALAGGRVGAMSIDQMTFESGGAQVAVRPGQNLFGQFVAAPAASQPGAAPASQPAPGQPAMPPAAVEQFIRKNQNGMILRSMPMMEESH